MTTLLIRLVRLESNITWGLFVNGQSFDDPCNRLGRQVYSPKNPGYPAFVSLPLRPGNPGMTRRTLDSQSYKDPEFVKVKTAIGHVRPSLLV